MLSLKRYGWLCVARTLDSSVCGRTKTIVLEQGFSERGCGSKVRPGFAAPSRL
jgi:hypothetical protein